MSSYPYIRANGLRCSKTEAEIRADIERAERENAPEDAWAYDDRRRRWLTIAALEKDVGNGNILATNTYAMLKSCLCAD